MKRLGSIVPPAREYSSQDFQTSTARVEQARKELLKNKRASEAYRLAGEEIVRHLRPKTNADTISEKRCIADAGELNGQ